MDVAFEGWPSSELPAHLSQQDKHLRLLMSSPGGLQGTELKAGALLWYGPWGGRAGVGEKRVAFWQCPLLCFL